MAPQKRPSKTQPSGKSSSSTTTTWSSSSSASTNSDPPRPFRRAADSLAPFYSPLSRDQVYFVHVDAQPVETKRKIFLFATAVNIAVVALFVWRMCAVGPFYWGLLLTAMGYPELAPRGVQILAFSSSSSSSSAEGGNSMKWWPDLVLLIVGRALTFALDSALFVFVWPWPVEFAVGVQRGRGSPLAWRWALRGFRDREVCVRRSRAWDGDNASSAKAVAAALAPRGGGGKEGKGKKKATGGNGNEGEEARMVMLARIRRAAEPRRLREKTGYVTVDSEWDLDFAAMARATGLVDRGTLALDAFRALVLLYDARRGCWLSIDMQQLEGGPGGETSAREEERRRQVFAFRDALAALGKEDLFFRWVEMMQFETSRPEGFGPERQVEAAQKVRDMFKAAGVDFDSVWKESVGEDSLAGM